MATWFPLVTRLRNIAEHALVAKDEPDPFRHARTTKANWIERALIAPYHVNFHAEHHLFMHMPCWEPAAGEEGRTGCWRSKGRTGRHADRAGLSVGAEGGLQPGRAKPRVRPAPVL
jgi:hypothetical protein